MIIWPEEVELEARCERERAAGIPTTDLGGKHAAHKLLRLKVLS